MSDLALKNAKKRLGSDYLLHLFWNPEHALPQSPIWYRLPRKIRAKHTCTEPDHGPGWGFVIRKEWDWKAFAALASPVILIGIVLSVVLCVSHEWPVPYGLALAPAPITTVGYINVLLGYATRQGEPSK